MRTNKKSSEKRTSSSVLALMAQPITIANNTGGTFNAVRSLSSHKKYVGLESPKRDSEGYQITAT